eukprot:scaffold5783_cov129-Amphora_coffeaeformis.AAC.8
MLLPATEALLRFQEADRCRCARRIEAPTDCDLYAAAVVSFPEIIWPAGGMSDDDEELDDREPFNEKSRRSKHGMVRSKSSCSLSRLGGSSTSLESHHDP